MMTHKTNGADAQLLATFRLRGSLYALDAAVVLEVMRLQDITPVPHAAGDVIGVMNLRGRIVTLLDIGRIMGLDPIAIGLRSRIFIVEDCAQFVGLLVDEVCEVVEIGQAEVQPPPSNISAAQLRYCRKVYLLQSRVVILVDAGALVESPALSAS